MAHADMIPMIVGDGGTGCGNNSNGFTCTYSYTATVHPLTEVRASGGDSTTANYFTIYDFNGYVDGSGFAPAGWEVIVNGSGWTPTRITATDDPNLPNLTFVYRTGSPIAGGTQVGTFGAQSIFGPGVVPGEASSQSTPRNTVSTPAILAQNISPVDVPNEQQSGDVVPEPLSFVLMGTGLLGLGLARRFVA